MVKISKIFTVVLLTLPAIAVNAQNNGSLSTTNSPAKKIIYKDTRIPAYLDLKNKTTFSSDEFITWISGNYPLMEGLSFELVNEDRDNLGFKHYRYAETYNGFEIIGTRYILHEYDGRVMTMNGLAFDRVKAEGSELLEESRALAIALDLVGADSYKWESEIEENWLKETQNDPDATWYPTGRLVWINPDLDFKSPILRLAWEFDIYAEEPLMRAKYYIDAGTGDLIFYEPEIHPSDSKGSANTKYSGVQTIITDSLAADSFRLRETGRGNGIETYNMQTGTNYGAAVDFYDDDNYWNNYNAQKDEVAGDAHWGAETTYDFYWNKFSRNSIDNNGFKIKSYVHYRVNYSNAFWNQGVMTYGDGNSSSNPYLSLDIIGHEITHGLTSFTANLIYQKQSGAMNEGFSDIFGNMIEYYGKPTQFDWRMGENTGRVIRDMSNPNARNNPDTYKGLFWTDTENCIPSSSNDNCGVHNNSGVLNYWFYLLAEGGNGTNDLTDVYHVNGLGKDKAAAIAFRCLTVYLFPAADYFDARAYSIQAASDLYGDCSNEVSSVLQAWFAVGIGDSTKSIVFEASKLQSCVAPLSVEFRNSSDGFESYLWDFGDGDTSSLLNPVHVYDQYGTFTVKLSAKSKCGNDSLIMQDLIKVDSNLPCLFFMSQNSMHDSAKLCRGKLFDDGGKDGNYSGNVDALFTIMPPEATTVTLHFQSFAFEGDCDCDWLYIYDGPDANSPLIGKYSNFDLPGGGVITSTGPSITIRQYTDPLQTYSGFELDWYCSHPAPPYVDFDVSNTFTCDGLVSFKSYVFNDPTGLKWDFGDGTVSYETDPVHMYAQSGKYTVKLVAENKYGKDSLIKTDYVVVSRPDAPQADNQENCGNTSFTFISSGQGDISWYEALGNQSQLATGDTFVTPVLTQTTEYYVEDVITPPAVYAGLADKDQGPGGIYSYSNYHALIFDCFKDVMLKSVKVYADGDGIRHIVLRNELGLTLQDTFINIDSGEQRLNLDFEIPMGTNFQLGCEPTAKLFRNNGGIDYPILLPGIIAITSTTAAASGYQNYYYFFYNWEVQEKPCISSRAKVVAYVNHSAPVADFSYTLNGLQVGFTNKSTEGNTFTWDFGDGTILTTSDMQPSYTYTNYGDYNVKLLVHNSCGDDSVTMKVSVTNSIFDLKGKALHIFPNPADKKLFIEYQHNGHQFVQLRLTDKTGRILIEKDRLASDDLLKYSIDISQLSRGIYLLYLIDGEAVVCRKVLVE